jgi:hypothetical protein
MKTKGIKIAVIFLLALLTLLPLAWGQKTAETEGRKAMNANNGCDEM